jgi:hypothetical protein
VKQEENNIVVERSGEMKSSNFGVRSSADMVGIFSVLRSKLYSNKILAVIREYSTNAFDEHVKCGFRDRPILVTLPNVLESTFKVRDYGEGLDEEGIRNVYCMYGASTKRNSNAYNGQMGFGSKSAFAYCQFWQISSFHEGVCRHYSVYLDETGLGEITFLSENPTTETGIEISIPVEKKDIGEFVATATDFYKWFEVTPTFAGATMTGVKMPAVNMTLKGGQVKILEKNPNGASVLMGNVRYPLEVKHFITRKYSYGSTDQEKSPYHLDDADADALGRCSDRLLISAHIGEVSVSASRESLEYNPSTLTSLKKILTGISTKLASEIESRVAAETNLRSRFNLARKLSHEFNVDTRSLKITEGGVEYNRSLDYGKTSAVRACDVRKHYNGGYRGQTHDVDKNHSEHVDVADTYLVIGDLDIKASLARTKILLRGIHLNQNQNIQGLILFAPDAAVLNAEILAKKIHGDFVFLASSLPDTAELVDDFEVGITPTVPKKIPKTPHKIAAETKKTKLLVPSGLNDTSARSRNWIPAVLTPGDPVYYLMLDSYSIKKVSMADFTPADIKRSLEHLIELKALPPKSVIVGVREKEEQEAILAGCIDLRTALVARMKELIAAEQDLIVWTEKIKQDDRIILQTLSQAGVDTLLDVSKLDTNKSVSAKGSVYNQLRYNSLLRALKIEVLSMMADVNKRSEEIAVHLTAMKEKYFLLNRVDYYDLTSLNGEYAKEIVKYIQNANFVEASNKSKSSHKSKKV